MEIRNVKLISIHLFKYEEGDEELTLIFDCDEPFPICELGVNNKKEVGKFNEILYWSIFSKNKAEGFKVLIHSEEIIAVGHIDSNNKYILLNEENFDINDEKKIYWTEEEIQNLVCKD